MTIEIPKELTAALAALVTEFSALFRKAYDQGCADTSRRLLDAIERRAAEMMKEQPTAASTKKPPLPPTPWTAEEEVHLEEHRLGRIADDELVKRLPNRTTSQIGPKIGRWKAKMAKLELALQRHGEEILPGSTENSVPPTESAVPPLEGGQSLSSGINVDGQADERPINAAVGDSESGGIGRRDELKSRSAAGSSPASRTTAAPSPQSRIDSEVNRAVRKSQGVALLSAPDSKPKYGAPLSTGVSEPPLDLPDSDKLMGSR